MKLKHKIVIGYLILSVILLLVGIALNNGYLFFAGIISAGLGFSTGFYADSDDKSFASIIFDGLLFGLI